MSYQVQGGIVIDDQGNVNVGIISATMVDAPNITVGIVSNTTIENTVFVNYAEEAQVIGNTGATPSIAVTSGGYFTATLNQSAVFTFNSSGIQTGFTGFILQLKNGTGGPFSITWPANVYWPDGGTVPSRTVTDSRTDIWTFVTTNNGTSWLGNIATYDYTI